MWIGPLWTPSMQAVLAEKFSTNVAPTSKSEADAVLANAKERVRSMESAGDVVAGSVWESYTRTGMMPSVSEKVWSLLSIKV